MTVTWKITSLFVVIMNTCTNIEIICLNLAEVSLKKISLIFYQKNLSHNILPNQTAASVAAFGKKSRLFLINFNTLFNVGLQICITSVIFFLEGVFNFNSTLTTCVKTPAIADFGATSSILL